jgi:hypothetical protein
MMAHMGIRDWPEDERPREKLLARGAAALCDAELLAILFRCGGRGQSALDLAREVLTDFGSLRKLLAADRLRFCATPGLGAARFAELQAAIELSRRQLAETLRAGPSLAGPAATREFLIARLRDLEHEVFCCLYLDLCAVGSYVHIALRSPRILDFSAFALTIIATFFNTIQPEARAQSRSKSHRAIQYFRSCNDVSRNAPLGSDGKESIGKSPQRGLGAIGCRRRRACIGSIDPRVRVVAWCVSQRPSGVGEPRTQSAKASESGFA